MQKTDNIKYTKDGKKVVVIGDLNQTDKIVQEIFVTKDGDEIPQGERFVERNLLDEPAKSWKETNIENLESRYEKDKKEWDLKIERLNNERQLIYDSLSARVKWLRNVAKEPRVEELKTVINQIADFLDGSEKWVFVYNYSDWRLEKFNEESTNELLDYYENGYGRKRFDEMRLLSLYGKSDGSLVYRINTYSDGSGSDKDVEFFKTKEAGLIYMQNKLNAVKEYSDSHIKIAKDFNLTLDQEKLNQLNTKNQKYLLKQIEDLDKQKEDLLSKLA